MLFPDPRFADDEGLIAIGGDYSPERLLAAYASGIFPWPSEELPYSWFSPNPRMVLRPEALHVPRSLRKVLKKERFRVTYDTVFDQVIQNCALRDDGDGTWLTPELISGLTSLHQLGLVHSVETWNNDELVGGLYGIALGSCFCGESMFFRQPDASKVAFVTVARMLEEWGFRMIDCQVHTEHLERFGAEEWPRDDFLEELDLALAEPWRRGPWTQAATIGPEH